MKSKELRGGVVSLYMYLAICIFNWFGLERASLSLIGKAQFGSLLTFGRLLFDVLRVFSACVKIIRHTVWILYSNTLGGPAVKREEVKYQGKNMYKW